MIKFLQGLSTLFFYLFYLGANNVSADAECSNLEEKQQCIEFRLDTKGPWGIPNNKTSPDKWLGVMENIKHRDQRYRGFCYAFSATDMAEAVFQAENPEHVDFPLITPIYATTQYQDTKGTLRKAWESVKSLVSTDLSTEGGFECDTFNQIAKNGFCSQKDVDPSGQFYEKLMVLQETSKQLRLWRNSQPSDSIEKLSLPNAIENAQKTLENEAPTFLCGDELIPTEIRKLVSNTLDIMNLVELDFNNVEKAYYQYVNNYCQKHLRPLTKESTVKRCQEVKGQDLLTNRKFLNQVINEQLKNPPVFPISLGLCSEVLTEDPKFGSSKANEVGKNCGLHAIILEGRRWNSKTCTCQLLLKDSRSKCDYADSIEEVYEKKFYNHKRLRRFVENGWSCDKTEKGKLNELFWGNENEILSNVKDFSIINSISK